MENSGNIDIHGTKDTYEKELQILNDSDILLENKELIHTFLNEYGHGLSPIRLAKYVIRYRWFSHILGKSFLKATREDIKRLETAIEEKPPQRYSRVKKRWVTAKKRCSPETVKDNKGLLRLLYKWTHHSYLKRKRAEDRLKGVKLREILRTKPVPELVEDVIAEPQKNHTLKSKDMLTWEECVKLSQATTHPMNKAAIQMIAESGVRAGEALTLQVQDLEIKRQGEQTVGVLHLRQSKTAERSIGLVLCVPALVEWLRIHPLREQRTAPLFLKFEDRYHNINPRYVYPMPYNVLRKILAQAKKATGQTKRCNPHFLRKSAASRMGHILQDGPALRQYFGWSSVSRAPKAYLFLKEEETNRAYWRSQGVEVGADGEPEHTDKIKPVKCVCGHVNPCGEVFCVGCGAPLDEDGEEYRRLDTALDRLIAKKLGLKMQELGGVKKPA